MRSETVLVRQVQEQIASAIPTRIVSLPEDGANPQPVKLDILPLCTK